MSEQSRKFILTAVFIVLAIFISDTRVISASSQKSAYIIENAFPSLTFTNPVGIYSPGKSSTRLFVVEQAGRIYSFENDVNVKIKELFLDIRANVLYGGEQGLLGLVFHPNYAVNGLFFVNYVTNNPRRTIISHFSVDSTNPMQADSSSEVIILEVAQPYGNHNGGQIAFNPLDGYLYIGLGDGGSSGDPLGHGQNRSTLLGSILRINVDQTAESLEYSIPADNPFAENTNGYREEIFAWGLRNPWRFSFDPEDETLWVGDVGERRKEEIDIIESGQNMGWNVMEGSSCYNPTSGCSQAGLTLPIWDYGRTDGISVTGGYIYRGNLMPELVGKYIYGDYGSGKIWALEFDGVKAENTLLLDSELNIPSFGVDNMNELYVCAFDNHIYKISRPTISRTANVTSFFHPLIIPVMVVLIFRKKWKT